MGCGSRPTTLGLSLNATQIIPFYYVFCLWGLDKRDNGNFGISTMCGNERGFLVLCVISGIATPSRYTLTLRVTCLFFLGIILNF